WSTTTQQFSSVHLLRLQERGDGADEDPTQPKSLARRNSRSFSLPLSSHFRIILSSLDHVLCGGALTLTYFRLHFHSSRSCFRLCAYICLYYCCAFIKPHRHRLWPINYLTHLDTFVFLFSQQKKNPKRS